MEGKTCQRWADWLVTSKPVTMQSTTIDNPSCVSTAPPKARRLVVRTAAPRQAAAEPEARLWKLTCKVDSLAQRAVNTSLFLLIGSLAMGAILNNFDRLFSFVGSDSLTQTVNLLLPH